MLPSGHIPAPAMRTPLTLLLATLTTALATAASLVSVEVLNPTERAFRISYETDAVTGAKRIFEVQLRDDNTASFELNLPGRTELLMRYDGVEIPLFIGPDDELSLTLDAADGIESVRFGGTAAADNEFLTAFAKTFPTQGNAERGGGFLPFVVDKGVLAEAAIGDASVFKAYIDEDLRRRLDLINAYEGRVNKRLLAGYRERARYGAEVSKIAFLLQNQQTVGREDLNRMKSALGVYGLPASQDPRKLQNDDFKNYLRAYAQYLILPNRGAHDEATGEALFAAIKDRIGRPWRHYLQSELLVNAFDYLGNPDFGLDRYTVMKRDGVQEVYRKRVEDAYGAVLNLDAGDLAPNIGMYDLDGRPMSLTDLGGKVLYVSFWASWCKPCISNFKKYDGIRSQLEQRGVVLLNVDIDEDEYDWKKAVKTYTPRGMNVRGTHLPDLKRAYNLVTIPAYAIIDRHGRIAVLPDGENRDLLAAFDQILAQ